jgi:hypothetical protein
VYKGNQVYRSARLSRELMLLTFGQIEAAILENDVAPMTIRQGLVPATPYSCEMNIIT